MRGHARRPRPGGRPLGFAGRVLEAFDACDRAVRAELERRTMVEVAEDEPEGGDEGPRSEAQSHALAVLCGRKGLGLDALARSRFATTEAALTSNQAATLIAELQAPASPAG